MSIWRFCNQIFFPQEEGWKTNEKVIDNDRPFDGYQLRDLIVNKWTVPYDIQIKREMFLGKPMLFLNVMWRHQGQVSFPLTEQVIRALQMCHTSPKSLRTHAYADTRNISSTFRRSPSCSSGPPFPRLLHTPTADRADARAGQMGPRGARQAAHQGVQEIPQRLLRCRTPIHPHPHPRPPGIPAVLSIPRSHGPARGHPARSRLAGDGG